MSFLRSLDFIRTVHLYKALFLNISNGISYLFFLLLYVSLFGFVFLIYAKINQPKGVGVYFRESSYRAKGKLNPDYLAATPHNEVLGNWFIPTMFLATIICYLLITQLLKLKRIINHK